MANFSKSFNFRNGVQVDNDNFVAGSPPNSTFETVKYGNNQYKGTRFDDGETYVGSSLGNSLVSQNFNFDLNQQFNEKLASMRYFSDLYNDDQTVTDIKLTGPGGSDKLNMSTAVYNSGYRRAYLSGQGGNNDYGTEPYYIKKVRKTNSGGVFDGLNTQFEQAGRDLVRISKFLTSPAGLAFIAKQNLLGINGRPNPYGSTGVSLTKKPGALEKGFLKEGGKLARWLPLAQKYKPFYVPSSTLANVASGLIGAQGSRIVRFDRDWPVKSGGAFGATNLNYTAYHNLTNSKDFTYDDKLFYHGQRSHRWQNHQMSLTAAANVNTSMDPKISRGEKRGFGDFMTLMEFNNKNIKQRTLKQAHPTDNKAINSAKNGMPFYFYDLRTNQYIIFRAYIESLTENIAPEWNPEKYVGRSEPVYTYTGAERDISFSLKLFAHTADELKMIYKKMNRLTSLCYPEYKEDTLLKGTPPAAAPITWGEKFTRMKAPLTKLRLGELYGKSGSEKVSTQQETGEWKHTMKYKNRDLTGFIKSLAYSIPDESPWEIKEGMRVPKYITVAISYQVLHDEVPNLNTNFYGYVGD